MFAHMKLRRKLLLAFASVAAMLVAVGVLASASLNRTVNTYRHVAEVNFYALKYIGEIYRAQKDAAIAVHRLAGSDEERRERSIAAMEKAVQDFETASAKYEKLPFGDGE